MTSEEQLIQRYFDAFNRHDLEAVMSCFHENPRIEDPEGKAFEGRAAVRRNYETAFVSMPDCRCDLRSFT
ncbi:MAG TPA: nuclear transport factor 2 family protein, partial [Candidatus Acidoferrales bacterium]|nr:nuclear transport factor 2 family protein [Candidatus Acidoferrales bacterium]